MGVVDREFPEPGSADQYFEVLKTHVVKSANEQKLHVRAVSMVTC
jgi:hypothetical protein